MQVVMRWFKKTLAVIFGAAGIFSLFWMAMNDAGYCHAENRFLSDEEYIRSAVKYVLGGYPPAISKKIEVTKNGKTFKNDFWYMPENPIKYKDVDDFLRLNPDCCKLGMRTGEGRRPGYFDRMLGYVATYVLIEYKVSPKESEQEGFDMDSTAVAVTNCGRAWSGL